MLIIFGVLLHLNYISNAIASGNCLQNQFMVDGRCCESCLAGTYVAKNCTEHTSTSCKLCRGGTFQEETNGRKCYSCKMCDAGLGLKVKKSCTSTSDALCEPLDGYFCSDSNRGGCMAAQRHTVCSPGQYISQTGTANKDTKCLQCTDGTFSDGASLSCQNHTKCESVGLKQIKPGNDSTDSECGEHGTHTGLVPGIISGIILLMALIIIIAIIKRKKRRVTAVMWKLSFWRSDHQPSDLKKPPEAGEEASNLPSSPFLSPEL